jgi:hypothetical protein
MAVVIEANYSKKVGLPSYSSHQYMVTVRTEVADLSQVQTESARLYSLLQTSVDRELQNPGFVPANGNGNGNGHTNGNGRNHAPHPSNSRHIRPANGNVATHDHWSCSPKQKDYILDLIQQHGLEKNNIEALAQDRFGKSVRQLNKLEASGLIEEIKEQVAKGQPTQSPGT